MSVPITMLGIIAAGALGTLGADLMHKALERYLEKKDASKDAPTVSGLFQKGISMYDLVGCGDAAGAIGAADLLLGGTMDEEAMLLSGLEDIIGGMGNTEIVGAAAHPAVQAAQKQQKVNAALRQVALRNAGAVVQRGLDRRRRYPLGFVPTTVAAATSASIPSAPQNLFRPERLVIPSDIAFDTGVRDIKVGNQSQLVQSVEVPAALFSEVAINTGVTFDTAEVGNQVSVDVRNKSGASFEFSAGLVGTIAK